MKFNISTVSINKTQNADKNNDFNIKSKCV